MFVNPISNFSKSIFVSKKSDKPAFKRQNYARVFTEQFNKPLKHMGSVEKMFDELLVAAQFKNIKGSKFFYNEFIEREIFGNLLRLVRPGTHDEYDKLIKASKDTHVPILTTESEEPIINIINNGRYDEDTFLKRLKGEEKANVNIVFHELDNNADKIILFGADYAGDVFVARGTVDIPAQRMETFYNDLGAGRLKQRVAYSPEDGNHIVENFHADGTPWTKMENFLDDFAWVIRNSIGGCLTK